MSLPDGGFDGPIGDYLRNLDALDGFGQPVQESPATSSPFSTDSDLKSLLDGLNIDLGDSRPTEGPIGTNPVYRWSVIPTETKILLRRGLNGIGLLVGSPEHALWSPLGETDFQREMDQFEKAMDLLYERGEVEKIAGRHLNTGVTRHIITVGIGQTLFPREDKRRLFLATIRNDMIQPSYYLNTLVKAVGVVNNLRSQDNQLPIAHFPFAS